MGWKSPGSSASLTTLGDGYNIEAGLQHWREAIADIDSNPTTIAIIGDSITFGAFASDILNTSWQGRMRNALQTKLGNVGIGSYPIIAASQTVTVPWTMANWNVLSPGSGGVFGRWATNPNGTSLTASVTFTGTSCDLIYGTASPGASSGVTVTIDGNAVTVPDFNSASEVWGNVQSYTGLTAASHTLDITTGTAGQVYLEGLIAYDPASSAPYGCYVIPFATPGAVTADFTPYAAKHVSISGAQLYIIALGVNDSLNSVTVAEYMTNMGTLISAYQAAGASVLLLICEPVNGDPQWPQFVEAQYQLAQEYNCALVDIYKRWGSAYVNTTGMYGTSNDYSGNAGTDGIHPSNKGHRDIANALVRQLIGGIS